MLTLLDCFKSTVESMETMSKPGVTFDAATRRAILKVSREAAKRARLKSCARCVWNARCVGNLCSWAGSRRTIRKAA